MTASLSRRRTLAALAAAAAVPAVAGAAFVRRAEAAGDGIVRVKSAHAFSDTVARLRDDVRARGIMLFEEIDQAALARAAGIELRPSTLLVFGNPPLGTQFIAARPEAGLDWPVRLLVYEDETGAVWTAYTDFAWIARRHGIATRQAQFVMAADVIASITASVAARA